MGRRKIIWKQTMQKCIQNLLFWEYVLLLGLPYPLVDATLVGNFIGSTGLAVANIATPVFLLYLLMGITLGGGAGVLIGKKLGEADLKVQIGFSAPY